ncbi:hypothetical protein QUF90_19185 [Desulfococcaceae bacterium HSG9]|nr:hypothetical protein [Desulfococcaceae bacterium HSG9]
MRKCLIIALALGLVVAFSLPAAALENIFGGYWRTRAYTNQDFDGHSTGAQDGTVIDTRTRLYYTAKFSDNLKFVNKFESNAKWGDADTAGYGDIGADGIQLKIKNMYIDANFSEAVNLKLGAQGFALMNGFYMDDDASGAKLTFNFGNVTLPLMYIKKFEEGFGDDAGDADVDSFAIAPEIKLGDAFTLKPTLAYLTSSDLRSYEAERDRLGLSGAGAEDMDLDLWTLGIGFDGSAGPASFGLTGIYQGGSIGNVPGTGDVDISAWLWAVNAAFNITEMADVHFETFYASGDDDGDNDYEAFYNPKGASYYWSEIMGYGTFDNSVSNGSPADAISNVWAINLGSSVTVAEKLKLAFDVWYARLAGEDVFDSADYEDDSDSLGTEVDFKASYPLIDNLNIDVVAAYLFADDATGTEDPWEMGTRLSLSF